MARDHILVVDDSPDNLLLIESILQEEGHELLFAQNGIDALKSIQQALPHLILLDVMMPGLDGFEVTRRLRGNPDLPFIPILLITAHDQPSAVRGLDLGADDFIRKPVDIDELSARVRSLLRLKHSVDEREQMARMREDFVSRLTHDLRTPLMAADRVLSLLQKEPSIQKDPTITEAMATLNRSNRNLLAMVNTLLEVYRYEAERKTLSFSAVDLTEIIIEVAQELKPLAEEKALYLRLAVIERGKAIIQGDRLELTRLVTNLIGNAIKFTDCGGIQVTLTLQPPTSASLAPIPLLLVEDTGVGIPLEDQTWLFNRFRTGKHRRSGSGLGLHLARQIVEKHGGWIEVISQVGKGSCFRVYFAKEGKE
jgi:two-component system sensor histidine kinase/response regulator